MPHQESDVHALVVGRTIAHLRELRGWSQQHLAQLAGISQPTLSRIERGQARPDAFECRRLAELLGVEPADLTRLVDDAFTRTGAAVRTVMRQPQSSPWDTALTIAGLAGLAGLVAIAVAAALADAGGIKAQRKSPHLGGRSK